MRLGLLGLGRIDAFHAETLAGLPAVEELVISDPVPALAEQVAGRLGARGQWPVAWANHRSSAFVARHSPRPGRHSRRTAFAGMPADEHLRHAYPGAGVLTAAAPSGHWRHSLPSRTVAAWLTCDMRYPPFCSPSSA